MIDKQTQDRAWASLSAAKRKKCRDTYNVYELATAGEILVELFGYHNLTSSAEPKEMLTAPKALVQTMYDDIERVLICDPTHDGVTLLKAKLIELFGSKCLPDDVVVANNAPTNDVSNNDEEEIAENANCSDVEKSGFPILSDGCKAELKFKVGDEVRVTQGLGKFEIATIVYCDSKINAYRVEFANEDVVGNLWYAESALEPYAETKEPKFKVGDKVMVRAYAIDEYQHSGEICEIRCEDPKCYDVRIGKAIWVLMESDLEPYTEPAQTNDNMRENESRDLSSNYGEAESEELNLTEILKGHEGSELFSQIWGEVVLNRLIPNNNNGSQPLVSIRISNGQCRNITADGHLCYGERFGKVILWPSEEAFFKHHDEPCKAWQEWGEANKPKRWRAETGSEYYYLDSFLEASNTTDDYLLSDDRLYKCGNYFRTECEAKQAAEAVKECFIKFHEQYNQK